MKRIAKHLCVAFLSVSILLPMPHACAGAKTTAGDILKMVAAQAIFAKLAPMLGLGPKKSKEQKEKEKQEKEQEKKDKEMKKAEKEKAKEEKAETAVEDPNTHIGMVKKWAEKGDVQAQCILAYAYHTGQRVPQDPQLAHIWQNRAAQQNIPLVKNFLPVEYGKKVIPLERLFSISGRRSHVGKYVKQDVKDAVRWSKLGAEEKDPMGIAYLGAAHYTGRGLPQDYKKALAYARATDKDPLSLYVLIDAYQFGKGVEKDTEKSEWYAKYLKLVVEKKQKKEKDKVYKQYEQEIKAGDLNGMIR